MDIACNLFYFFLSVWAVMASYDECGFRLDLDQDKAYHEAQLKRCYHLKEKYEIREMMRKSELQLDEFEFNKQVKLNKERNKRLCH